MNLNRKEFLRDGFISLGRALLCPSSYIPGNRASALALRPPGFTEELRGECRECEACLSVCPSGCLEKRPDLPGPVFVPRRGSCTSCLQCIDVCPRGVLAVSEEGERLRPGLALPENDRCLAHRGGCFTCPERCPEQAIRIDSGTGLVVDQERCTGCGTCENVCPLDPAAIRIIPVPS